MAYYDVVMSCAKDYEGIRLPSLQKLFGRLHKSYAGLRPYHESLLYKYLLRLLCCPHLGFTEEYHRIRVRNHKKRIPQKVGFMGERMV